MTVGRIAYLTSQYPAASHTFIRREVEALREEGWTVHTFSIRMPGAGEAASARDCAEEAGTFYVLEQSPFAFVAAHGATFFGNPAAYVRTLALSLSHRAPGARGMLLGLAHFVESVVLARELKRRRVHHLHNHFANSAATVGLLASRLLGIDWSFTMHGISETDYPAGLMLGRKIEAADMVACVSWFGRAQGLRMVGAQHWDKVHVVRCGIPFDRLPTGTPRASNSKTIVCVGRLSPEKGQAGLLKAFGTLRSIYPHLRLRFVGEGPDRAALEALADRIGVGDAVRFVGRLPEEQTLVEIARSDLLVLPSFMEGLPIVLMEAMALGVPVIASRVAGIPELVEDGATGLLFSPSDWDELTAKIERLLRDDALRSSVRASGHARVTSEFDTRKSARMLSELFGELRERRAQ